MNYTEKLDLNQLKQLGVQDEIEQVSIEHTITAVFINSEEAKQQGLNENESPGKLEEELFNGNDDEEIAQLEDLADMKSAADFQVYQRIKSSDFKKFYFESVVPVTRPFSLRNFFCCNFFKKKEFLYPVKISLDRLTFRQID